MGFAPSALAGDRLLGLQPSLVGKTLINVFHCHSAEIRFVSKLVIIQTFSQTNGLDAI